MNDIFSTESKYYRLSSELGYMLMLGALVLVFSLPLITVGPSLAAGYYVATKRKSGRDDYLLRSFLKSYRRNLVQGVMITLILGVIGALLFINANILIVQTSGVLSVLFSMVLLLIAIQWTVMSVFAFPLLARFELTALQSLRAALLLGNKHVKTTVACIVIFLMIGILGFLAGPVLLFALGIYIYFTAGLFVRVFRHHDPTFDGEMSDESLRQAAESEEAKGVNHRDTQ